MESLNYLIIEIKNFFITSTAWRTYSDLLDGLIELNKRSIDFILNIVGHSKKILDEKFPNEIKKKIKFYGKVTYQKMYEIILNSDFIIINIYPDRIYDNGFKTFLATGSAQLAYGFCKPVLIEETFLGIYKFSYETAIIFKGHDLSSAMINLQKYHLINT